MEPFEYKGYTITPNVHEAEGRQGKWVFEAATITDSSGNEVSVAAPTDENPHLFDDAESAAKVCISQAKALIEAGDLG
ncbi:MAG: hypothetical protein ACLFP4_10435 [Spirochaetales bacterium]